MANERAKGSAKAKCDAASQQTNPANSQHTANNSNRTTNSAKAFPHERNKAKQSSTKAPQAPRGRIRTGAQLIWSLAAQAEAGIKETQDTGTQAGGTERHSTAQSPIYSPFRPMQ